MKVSTSRSTSLCDLKMNGRQSSTLQVLLAMTMMFLSSSDVTATTATPTTNLNTLIDLRHDPLSVTDRYQMEDSKSSSEVSIPTSRNNESSQQQQVEQQQEHDILPNPLTYPQQPPDGLNIVQSYHWFLLLHDLRAGARYDYRDDDEDEYDDEDFDEEGEYDDDDDEEEETRIDYRPRPRPPPSRIQPDPRRSQRQTRDNNRRYPPPPLPKNNKRKRRQPHWTQRMATKSLSVGTSMVFDAMKQTGKLAYNIKPKKKISLNEINGLWRLDQQVIEGPKNAPNPKILVSVATITLDSRKRILTVKDAAAPAVVGDRKKENRQNNANADKRGAEAQQQQQQEQFIHRPFEFTRTRLGSFKTEFVAPAFLVGDKPRWYGYRGTWQRKAGDSTVIKFIGKIYIVRKQRFGKEKGKFLFGKPVGTFQGRKRVQIKDDDTWDEDEDEYDPDDEEYDGDEYDNEGNGFEGDEDLTEGYDSDYH